MGFNVGYKWSTVRHHKWIDHFNGDGFYEVGLK